MLMKQKLKSVLYKVSPVYQIAINNQKKLESLEKLLAEESNSIKSQIENLQIKLIPPPFHYEQNGFCPVCEKDTIFFSEKTWLRDYFVCKNCASIPRQRALITVIKKYYPNWKELNIHESSPSGCLLTNKLKNECKGYIGTQCYPKHEFGSIVNGY